MPSSRAPAPLLPVAISHSPLLSGPLPDDLFANLAKPLPTITIGPFAPSSVQPEAGLFSAYQPFAWSSSSSLASSPSSAAPPSTTVSPKEVISLLNLLESMENDIVTEVQRVRLGIQEARTLVRECRQDCEERTRALQKRRERERRETKGAEDDFWLGTGLVYMMPFNLMTALLDFTQETCTASDFANLINTADALTLQVCQRTRALRRRQDWTITPHFAASRQKMWLLETSTGKLHYFPDPSRVNYAILSHVWIPGKEQTFQDLQALHTLSAKERWTHRLDRVARRPRPTALAGASEKIRECCAFARARDYSWLWVDTCCIDKTSSAELSEAINSMYQWYAQAGVCYAFLHDVDGAHDPRALGSQFRQSRWFRRGWTLQELIAPRELVFVSKQWRPFGTKRSLADVVEDVTGVERAVLEHRRPLSSVSVARRMAWAAQRKTTRVEDEAYALMGIFGVNIPTIYGEGRGAFYRLQEEILRHIPDQSIFAWGPLVFDRYQWPGERFDQAPSAALTAEDAPNAYLFAPSPSAFEHSAGITPLAFDAFQREIGVPAGVPDYTVTSYGIHTRLPLVPLWPPRGAEVMAPHLTVHVAVLACVDAEDGLVALFLRAPADRNHEQYEVGCRYREPDAFVRGATLRCLRNALRMMPASPASHFNWLDPGGALAQEGPMMASVYILYRPFELQVESFAMRRNRPLRLIEETDAAPPPRRFFCPCEVVIPAWTLSQLHEAGYAVVISQDHDGATVQVSKDGPLVSVVLSRGAEQVHISLGPCPSPHGLIMPKPLVALVAVGKPPVLAEDTADTAGNVSSRNGYLVSHRPPEQCRRTHVQDWTDGRADFALGEKRLVLQCESWTDYLDSGNHRGLYALTVQVEEAVGGQG
ncbi:HET-domain-containing protein [Trametes elegans]|nr:HET-domain-containing protein [Trametes elegans]